MRIAAKYRLYPNKNQEQILNSWMGQLRFVWNWLLADNIAYHEETQKFHFKFDMKKKLPAFKKQYLWIDAPAHALQNRVFDLDKAIRRCVVERTANFPRFKKKGVDKTGIKIDQVLDKQRNKTHIELGEKHILVPKIGKIRYVRHRDLGNEITSINIKREADHWYVVCLFKTDEIQPVGELLDEEIIGLDMGLIDFFTDCSGNKEEIRQHQRRGEKRLARAQRELSRAKKGSKNRNKRRLRVARLHRKVANQRRDFHHQTAHAIAKRSTVVCVETLSIKGMVRNRRFGKSIHDAGWDSFLRHLAAKLHEKGGWLERIDRWYPSTKTCSSCGVLKEMPLGERRFACDDCGHVMCRDQNAAINIRREGMRQIIRAGTARIHACGDTSDGVHPVFHGWASHVSLKQEAAIPLGSR